MFSYSIAFEFHCIRIRILSLVFSAALERSPAHPALSSVCSPRSQLALLAGARWLAVPIPTSWCETRFDVGLGDSPAMSHLSRNVLPIRSSVPCLPWPESAPRVEPALISSSPLAHECMHEAAWAAQIILTWRCKNRQSTIRRQSRQSSRRIDVGRWTLWARAKPRQRSSPALISPRVPIHHVPPLQPPASSSTASTASTSLPFHPSIIIALEIHGVWSLLCTLEDSTCMHTAFQCRSLPLTL